MKQVRLGDVCTVVGGSTPKSNIPEYWNGDIKWITPAELASDSYFIYDTERHITDIAVKKTNLNLLPVGTVLLSCRAPIGKIAIVGSEMYCNQGFKNLVCSDNICNKYLYFFLKSKKNYLDALGRGATFKEISKSIVEDVKIPLPTMEEQHKIACTFEILQNDMEMLKRLADKLDTLVKSRFIEMFGDPVTNPMGWDKEPLKKHTDVIVGYPFSSTEYVANGIPIVGGYNLMQGFVQWENSKYLQSAKGYEQYLLKDNDIVIAMDRPWVGNGFKIAVIQETYLPAILIQRTACIRCCDVSSAFLYMLLDNVGFADHCHITGSLVPHISNKDILSYEIIVPPIALQNHFAAFVQQVDKSKSVLQKLLEKQELLRSALMQEYFG